MNEGAKEGDVLDLSSLRAWAKESLANHKLPSRLLLLNALPRNSLGKVVKPALAVMFETSGRGPVS
jgi:malonyl-CoA/methylmalonyl-CoA synthetase